MAGKNKSKTRVQTGLNEPKNMPGGMSGRKKSAGANRKKGNSGGNKRKKY